MRRRSPLVAAVAVAAVLLTAAPAAAEARGRVVGLQASDGALQVAFSVAGLEPGQDVDPASIAVTLAGRPVQAQLADGSTAASVQRTVMLTIDTSGSMRGPGIEGARAAADAFLDAVPADVAVGLVTFSDAAQVLVPPSTDRVQVRQQVSALQASGDTALYDAVALAADNLPDEGESSILLLSDGADDGSARTLQDTAQVLRDGGAALNAVAFRNDQVQSTLTELTGAAGGRLFAAEETDDLAATFQQAAAGLDRQLALVVPLPQGFTASEATVTVAARTPQGAVTDSALAVGLRPAAASSLESFGPQPVSPVPDLMRAELLVPVAVGLVFLGLLVLVGVGLTGAARRPSLVDQRLSIYSVSGPAAAATFSAQEPSRSLSQSVLGLAEQAVKRRGLEERLNRRLEAGAVPLKPAEWLLVHAGTVLLVPLFVLLLSNGNAALVLLALVLAALGPLAYLRLKARLRTRAFLAQLPDVLQLMSGSLSSGYSLPQSVDAVVRQGNEPMASEFNKALVEARLGAPVEDALEDVGTRMASKDFSWVVMAIRIQRDVGGNLAEVLATTAATLRERERLRRQVQVLSAEGRLSAWIIGGLPIAFALYLLVARPEYLKPLVEDPLGLVLIGAMVLLMGVGSLWLRKVVKVEV